MRVSKGHEKLNTWVRAHLHACVAGSIAHGKTDKGSKQTLFEQIGKRDVGNLENQVLYDWASELQS